MGNCLKTQLKEAVQNEDLKKTDELLLSVSSINEMYFGVNQTTSPLSPCRFTSGVTHSDVVNNRYNLSGTGKVFVKNDISSINYSQSQNVGNISISDLKYGTSLSAISFEKCSIENMSINDIISSFSGLSSLVINQCALEGELTSISNNIEIFKIVGNSISGNISTIGRFKKITTVNVAYTEIQGTLEDFVAAQRSVSNTTGSVVFENCANTNLKYKNNESLPSGNHTLTWDATKQYLDGTEF